MTDNGIGLFGVGEGRKWRENVRERFHCEMIKISDSIPVNNSVVLWMLGEEMHETINV